MDPNLPKKLSDLKDAPPTTNVGKKIIILGTSTCPDCQRVKKFLAENAIEYDFLDVESNKDAFKWLTSFASFVPVLIMLDQTIMYSPSNEELLEKIKTTSVNGKVEMVEPQVFDLAIIGAGPAGVSAAIYAVRKSLKVLMLTKSVGGQAALSSDIENVIGFTLISGQDLSAKFKEELEKFKGEGLWIKEGVTVTEISGSDNNFSVKTENSVYKSKTILIASGRSPKLLNIPGEKQFFGKGVATCATCDGPLFKGKDVAVIGGGNSALDAAFSLMRVAKTVTIINCNEDVKGDDILIKNVKSAPNVKILNKVEALEILGSQFVEGVKIKSGDSEQTINVNGVLIEVGYKPETAFDNLTSKNERGEIIVDEMGKTSVEGIWAAGDVNNLWGEQIIIAAGEGAKTALSIAEHIAKVPHQTTSNAHMG